MTTKSLNVSQVRRMIIHHSRNKCKIIKVGKTPKGSSFFKAIYKTNNQTHLSELFLRKQNGEERVVTIHSMGIFFDHKKMKIEDSKDNIIIRDKHVNWVLEDGKVKSEIDKNKQVGQKVTLKQIVYKANKAFIDKFVKGVVLPPEKKQSFKTAFQRMLALFM